MKRLPIYAAAALAATVPFAPEAENAVCKDRNCANEVVATQLEQPHSHEEPPEYQGVTDVVVIPSSPVVTVERNSPEHRWWIKSLGEDGSSRIEEATKYFLQYQQ
jgi:hypothetical protein